MIHRFTLPKGYFTPTHWLFGFILMCSGILMPHQVFSALTVEAVSVKAAGYPFSVEQASITTWSAFDSVQARNVCVRVNNSGTQDMTVWLHHRQSVVGLFTVLPQHISAMCTTANKIELGCSGDSCESTWIVFDAP